MDKVVLVDESGKDRLNSDGSLKTLDKLEAHRRGILHRAVSVFIFNSRGQLLLQKRAAGKYHSSELWTNTCCTHPRTGEKPSETACRRLREEMGLESKLKEIFSFLYQADVGNGLIEYEFDHVFTGISDRSPAPDPAEASDWKWISLEDLEAALAKHPEEFTPWLPRCFPEVKRYRG